jgi:hypothetical protein
VMGSALQPAAYTVLQRELVWDGHPNWYQEVNETRTRKYKTPPTSFEVQL